MKNSLIYKRDWRNSSKKQLTFGLISLNKLLVARKMLSTEKLYNENKKIVVNSNVNHLNFKNGVCALFLPVAKKCT